MVSCIVSMAQSQQLTGRDRWSRFGQGAVEAQNKFRLPCSQLSNEIVNFIQFQLQRFQLKGEEVKQQVNSIGAIVNELEPTGTL